MGVLLLRRKSIISLILVGMLFCILIPVYCIAAVANELQVGEKGVTVDQTLTNGNTFSASIKGETYVLVGVTKTKKITLKNTNSFPVLIYYSANTQISGTTDNDYIKIGDSKYDGSPIAIAANSSVTVTLSAKGSSNTTSATFTVTNIIKNITYSVDVSSSQYGSCTPSGKQEVNAATGLDISVSPKDGYTCIGLVDAAGNWVAGVNTSGTAHFAPTADCVITPVFVETKKLPSSAPFRVGDNYYLTWEGAFATGGITVILAQDYTLPAEPYAYYGVQSTQGNYAKYENGAMSYTVPAGVTLLVPYTENTTAFTSPAADPDKGDPGNHPTTPGVYRTLTVPSGTTIHCNGSIRVDAMQNTASDKYTGCVSGKYGLIELGSGARLNMNSGSTLRAFGYITGAGTVNCTGATVYELFQVRDWRGGSVSLSLSSRLAGESFLISQFYVQNIETTLVADVNSSLVACATITASSNEYSSEAVMLGAKGLFQLENGKVTRLFHAASGRVEYVIDGDLKLGSVSVSAGSLMTLKTSDYVLTFPANMSVTVNSGTTNLSGSFKLQPGAKWTVSKGATLNLNSGAELIIYDYTSYTTYNGSSANFSNGGSYCPLHYSPTKVMSKPTEPGQLTVDGTLNINSGAGVYITTGQKDDAPLLTGTGTVKLDSNVKTSRSAIKESNNNDTSTTSVTVTPIQAFLCSAPDSFTQMAKGTTYTGDGKLWHILSDDGCYCTVCKYIMKLYTNMVFGNDLKVKFAFPMAAISDKTDCKVVIDRSYSDGRANDEKTIEADDWSTSGQYYVVVYDGVAAKEMCDKICVTVYNSSGAALSVTWEDGIREYAMRVLENNKDNEITRTAYVDMLNYGAAAQTYFKYGTADLANAKLNETQKAWASSECTYTNSAVLGDKHVGSQLVFKSNIAFRVAFRGLSTDMTASVSYTNHYGNPVEKIDIKITDSNKSGSYYYVVIPDLVVADAHQLITVTIYNADGTEFTKCTESIESYLARATKSSDLNMAFIKFADSAHAYLHRNDSKEGT